jgi:hypothetical protein
MSSYFAVGITIGYFFYDDVSICLDFVKTCLESVLRNKRKSCCRPKKTFVIPTVDSTFFPPKAETEEFFQGELNTDINDNIYESELLDSKPVSDSADANTDANTDATEAEVNDAVVAESDDVPQIN